MARGGLYDLPNRVSNYHKNKKLVGAYIPRQLSYDLALIVLYRHTSVSAVLEEIITNHVENHEPVPDIIEIMANRTYQLWAKKKNKHIYKHPTWKEPSHVKNRFDQFVEYARLSLRRRKISEHHTNEIIRLFIQMAGDIYKTKEAIPDDPED